MRVPSTRSEWSRSSRRLLPKLPKPKNRKQTSIKSLGGRHARWMRSLARGLRGTLSEKGLLAGHYPAGDGRTNGGAPSRHDGARLWRPAPHLRRTGSRGRQPGLRICSAGIEAARSGDPSPFQQRRFRDRGPGADQGRGESGDGPAGAPSWRDRACYRSRPGGGLSHPQPHQGFRLPRHGGRTGVGLSQSAQGLRAGRARAGPDRSQGDAGDHRRSRPGRRDPGASSAPGQ